MIFNCPSNEQTYMGWAPHTSFMGSVIALFFPSVSLRQSSVSCLVEMIRVFLWRGCITGGWRHDHNVHSVPTEDYGPMERTEFAICVWLDFGRMLMVEQLSVPINVIPIICALKDHQMQECLWFRKGISCLRGITLFGSVCLVLSLEERQCYCFVLFEVCVVITSCVIKQSQCLIWTTEIQIRWFIHPAQIHRISQNGPTTPSVLKKREMILTLYSHDFNIKKGMVCIPTCLKTRRCIWSSVLRSSSLQSSIITNRWCDRPSFNRGPSKTQTS